MYSWVDRPFGEIDDRSRLLVWAMRRWKTDKQTSGCGCLHVGPAFHAYGLISALPDFQIAMQLLDEQAISPILEGAETVSEHEAILLALLNARLAGEAAQQRLRQVLGGLIHAAKLEQMAAAISGISSRLQSAEYAARDHRKEDKLP